MQMIRKLGENEKADWPGHLAEIVHAYNTTQSTVTGYSPTLLNVWVTGQGSQANFYFPTLRSTEIPKWGDLYQACGWICSLLFRDHLKAALQEARSSVYGRRSKTEMVLWLENWHHRFETWWSCPSQGGYLSREEEDQGQMGGQATWGSTPDHDRCLLIQSEGPALWTFTHLIIATSSSSLHQRLVFPYSVGVCQVQDRCTSSTPVKPTPRGEWQQDNATRGQWSGNHPVSG